MYELWQIVRDVNELTPLFLIDRGDFDKLYIKFKENKTSIITNKKGSIIESHFKLDKNNE